MTEIYSATSSISPFSAILWCFYPIAILVLVELFLGGGFDDDNDDQDTINKKKVNCGYINLFSLHEIV